MTPILPIEEMDKHIKRHESRRKRFMKEGVSEDAAFDLAEAMFDRDNAFGGDDRRVCFECSHYEDATKLCLAKNDGRKLYPDRFLLWRCPNFKLRGVK